MKKQIFLSLVTVVAILFFASCNKYQAKKCDLKTQNDSLNYTLGLVNGEGIKTQMMKDTTDKAIAALVKAIDAAYNKKVSTDEMYKLGEQIGNSFKEQKAHGLMGDSTLKFDAELVKQGLINALKDHKEGMSTKEAEKYIQTTMMNIQAKKTGAQHPMSNEPQPAQQPQVK